MKSILQYMLMGFFPILFVSCNNDLDLIDDYKETPVIYGLLSLSDDTQYVRVQKAFLGEGNALLMAQYSDSIYYDTAFIKINLEETVNGSITRNIPMMMDGTQQKDEGLFVNSPHLIYRTDSLQLNKDARYKLIFNNAKTGKTVTGSTPIVGRVLTPIALAFPFINLSSPNALDIKINSAANAKIYGLNVVFNYAEKKTTNPINDYVYKSINYVFPEVVNNNQGIHFYMQPSDFFSFIGSHIPLDTSLTRSAIFTSMDFVFSTGAEDFYIYYTVNQPSLSLAQNIPDFTNLSDGKGIFSSRNKNIFFNIKFNNASTDSLINGQYTRGRFVN